MPFTAILEETPVSQLYWKRLPCLPLFTFPPPLFYRTHTPRPSPVQASVILQLLLASMPHALLACDRRKLMRLTTRETAPSCGAPGWGGEERGGAGGTGDLHPRCPSWGLQLAHGLIKIWDNSPQFSCPVSYWNTRPPPTGFSPSIPRSCMSHRVPSGSTRNF